jgi:hypothetical protein
VLRTSDHYVLVDWDNVGTLAPWRELGALLTRHLNHPATLRQIVTTYQAAAAPATPPTVTPSTFATGLAIHLNFLHGQASASLDPNLPEAHRSFARQQVGALLTSLPTIEDLEEAAAVARG